MSTPTQTPLKRDPAKVALQQIAAGGSAGLVEILIMQPLDVVKTRFQLQTTGAAGAYNGLGDCFKTIYRTEGVGAFYKGILPPIFAETPKRATKFFTFEIYQNAFNPYLGRAQPGGTGENKKTPLVYSAAGFCSGATEAIVINPFERVKVQLQAEKGKGGSSPFEKAKQIYAEGGIGTKTGLNRGLTATIGRHSVWNMIYFGFYHSCKDLLPPRNTDSFDWNFFLKRILLGFTGGSIASIVNIPYDVAKSRIQGPTVYLPDGTEKYRGAHQAMLVVAREEGPKALFKGLAPKLMRLGPSGAIMMLVYETLLEKFTLWWP